MAMSAAGSIRRRQAMNAPATSPAAVASGTVIHARRSPRNHSTAQIQPIATSGAASASWAT